MLPLLQVLWCGDTQAIVPTTSSQLNEAAEIERTTSRYNGITIMYCNGIINITCEEVVQLGK